MLGLSARRSKETVITRADRALTAGELELALDLYRQALDRNPRNPPIWIQCGHVLKESGRLQEAETAYRRAASYDPRAADPYLHLGHALKLQGRREEAQSAYMRAFTLDSTSPDAARELAAFGWAEDRLEQLRQAVRAPIAATASAGAGKRASTRRFGRKRASVITLADRARDAGEWEDAARFYRKALDRNPRNSPIWVQYGHALKESGRPAEAEAAYRDAAAHAPSAAEPWLQLGHLLTLRGRNSEAEAAYLRAFALAPASADPLNGLRALGWSDAGLHELREASGAATPNPALGSSSPAEEQTPRHFDAAWYLRQNPDIARAGIDPLQHFLEHGFKEGRWPSPQKRWSAQFFDPDWYLRQNPDVARAGTDPLEHFLRDGFREGRHPHLARLIPGTYAPVTDAEISCVKQPVFGDEVALLVTHSASGRLRPHLPHYLAALTRHGIAVILIIAADAPFADFDLDILRRIGGVFVRQNKGYDFAAWAHVLRLHPELFDAKILYLLNDSVFGPTNDAAFGQMLTRLRGSPADLVGLTENFHVQRHFQSYFMALKAGALASAALHGFVRSIVSFEAKEDVIEHFEIQLMPTLALAGLKCEVLFPGPDGERARWCPTTFHWKYLLEAGFPFLKVNILRDDEPDADATGWRGALAGRGYDVTLAERTLALDAAQAVGNPAAAAMQVVSSAHRAAAPAPGTWRLAFIGPWNYSNGLGVAGRGYIAALRRTGLPINLHPITTPFYVHQQVAPTVSVRDFDGDADVAIVHVNPDAWGLAGNCILSDEQMTIIARARVRIGLWVWEAEPLPPYWQAAFDKVDAVWAPSRYCADLFAAATSRPVDVIPHVVTVPPELPGPNAAKSALHQFGISDQDRIVLYAFDGTSYLARKNPAALIRAFGAAGLAERGWRLVLKTKHLSDSPEEGNVLRQQVDSAAGVILIDRRSDRDAFGALMRAADIYASPHSSEGFGLTVAEAMALGKIVVATDYSGSRDLLDPTCGFPVRYRLARLDGDQGLYPADSIWAQIDEDHLAESLTAAAGLVAAGDFRLGEAARERVRERLSPEAVADRMRQSISRLFNQA